MGHFQSLQHLIERRNRLCIWVLGGPCSGRSTQCKLLAEKFQLAHISAEAIVRACLLQEEIRKRDARLKRLGQKRMYTYNAIKTQERMVQEKKETLGPHHENLLHPTISTHSPSKLFALRDDPYPEDDNLDCPRLTRELLNSMRRGRPINPAVITILIEETMGAQKKNCNGFLIDGYPRDLDQEEMFIQEIGMPHVLLYLESPDHVLKDRIQSRAELAQRRDDNEFTIRSKLGNFHKNTLPVIQKWMSKFSVEPINGHRDIDEVTKSCSEIIKAAFGSNFKYTKKIKGDKNSLSSTGRSSNLKSSP